MPSPVYDIVIVGAGPAGSSAALAAARKGVRVLLLEKKAHVGLPVQCGEYVPLAVRLHVDMPPSSVIQQVDSLRTYLPDGSFVDSHSPGYTLNRALFDQGLAGMAVEAGALLMTRTRAIEPGEGGIWVVGDGQRFLIRAGVIIGADGPSSTVGKWIGQTNTEIVWGYQYEVTLSDPQEEAAVYFHPDFWGGYGWLFPKGDKANVGVAISKKKGSIGFGLLHTFWERLEQGGKVHGSTILSRTAGPIPVNGPLRTVEGNILLVGDAAGQTNPLTGAGILNALLCGELAGEIAAQAVIEGDLAFLQEYEAEWKACLGSSLARAARKRRLWDENWSTSPVYLSDVVRKSWTAFPDYYEE